MAKKVYVVLNPMTPSQIIFINNELCNGCNMCVDVCRRDVLLGLAVSMRFKDVVRNPLNCRPFRRGTP